jgi:hypothetical protein
VASMVMVTGRGPQEKVITPPAATAATTAFDVQLAAVPSPMTRVGWEVSTGRPAGGTYAWPAGLPAAGSRTGRGDGLGLGAGELAGPAPADRALGDTAEVAAGGWRAPPHAASVAPDANAIISAPIPPSSRTRPPHPAAARGHPHPAVARGHMLDRLARGRRRIRGSMAVRETSPCGLRTAATRARRDLARDHASRCDMVGAAMRKEAPPGRPRHRGAPGFRGAAA